MWKRDQVMKLNSYMNVGKESSNEIKNWMNVENVSVMKLNSRLSGGSSN